MSVDPVLKALLETMQAQPTLPTWQMEPVMARAAFAMMMQTLSSSFGTNVSSRDVRIPGPGGAITLRVYTPAGLPSGPSPAMLYFHGGGFVIGNLQTHDDLCRVLADGARLRIIAVDYRLAPEHPFPAALEDGEAALRYVIDHHAKFAIDPARLAVGGDSSGGTLAALLAQQSGHGGAALAFQLLLFPVTQMAMETASRRAYAEGYFMERATLDWFYDHYLPKTANRADPRISPLFAPDFSALPPAYVMLAGYDPLHDEGLAYAEKLKAAGVDTYIDDYPTLVHDFIYMTNMLPQARIALAKAGQAVKQALNPG